MKNRLTNNLGLKAMAVLFAILLWLVVVNIDDPVDSQTFRNIEVTIQHPEVITNKGKTYQVVDNTQSVTVVVEAKRSILAKIKGSDIVAIADMKEMELASQVPITISITGYEGKYEKAYSNPRNLQVLIEDETSNKFPITAATTGTLRDGFALGEIKAIPETVTIGGAESMVSRISKVVAKVDVSGLSKDTTLEGELVLYDADDNAIDQTLLTSNLGESGVSVEIKLLQTKTVALECNVSGTPDDGYRILEVKYEPQTVLVSGTSDVLADLEKITIPGKDLDITGISKKTERVVDITPYLPEGVSLADQNANNVIVTIGVERVGTKTIDIPVGSIKVKNAPENMKTSYGNIEDVILEFQGSDDALASLTVEKVEASIDLKNYQNPGSFDIPLLVEAPNCSLTSNITVNVILEQK
ncbi:CdaR family protein [Lachnospiraceae bacterium LCP25S3_G4]